MLDFVIGSVIIILVAAVMIYGVYSGKVEISKRKKDD